MGWPKGKKRETEVEEVKPFQYIEPVSEVSPKENELVGVKSVCRDCKHDENIHYEGAHKQCNTSGCRCVRLVK